MFSKHKLFSISQSNRKTVFKRKCFLGKERIGIDVKKYILKSRKLANSNLNKKGNLKQSMADMAKVQPAGRIRPFNLFLRPANLFVISKQLKLK